VSVPTDQHREGTAGNEFATETQPTATANELTNQAKELVAYFFKRFHNVEKSYPNSKAINQAISLITQYGIDQARHVVDFAHGAAQETKFKIETFGGIIAYTSRAVADFEKRQKSQRTQAAIAACTFCDRAGLLSLRNATGSYTSVKCSHDAEQMRAAAQSQGYQIV
jgi:hypothetical protein